MRERPPSLGEWISRHAGDIPLLVRQVGPRQSTIQTMDGSGECRLLPFQWEFLLAVEHALELLDASIATRNDVKERWDSIVGHGGRETPVPRTFTNYWSGACASQPFALLGLTFSKVSVERRARQAWRVEYPFDPMTRSVQFEDVLDWKDDDLHMLVDFRRRWDCGDSEQALDQSPADAHPSYRIAYDLAWSHSIGRLNPVGLEHRLRRTRELLADKGCLIDGDLRDAALRQWHRAHAVASRSRGEAETSLRPHLVEYTRLAGPKLPDGAAESLMANLERSRFNRLKDARADAEKQSASTHEAMMHRAEQSLRRGCRAVFLAAISDDQRTLSAALCNLGLAYAHFFENSALRAPRHGALEVALRLVVASHKIDIALHQSAMERVFIEQALCKIVGAFQSAEHADRALRTASAHVASSWREVGSDFLRACVNRAEMREGDVDRAEILVLMAYRARVVGKFLGCLERSGEIARQVAKSAVDDKPERGRLLRELVEWIATIMGSERGLLSPAREGWLHGSIQNLLLRHSDAILAVAHDVPPRDEDMVQRVVQLWRSGDTSRTAWKALSRKAAEKSQPHHHPK